jgi:Ni/Co efflux regulator RcnB
MFARRILLAAAGAAVLAAAMFAAASSAEALCKRHYHEGRATGLLRATAGIAARADWRREVRSHDGADYTRWSRARDRVTRCRKPEGGRWRCIATARACNS